MCAANSTSTHLLLLLCLLLFLLPLVSPQQQKYQEQTPHSGEIQEQHTHSGEIQEQHPHLGEIQEQNSNSGENHEHNINPGENQDKHPRPGENQDLHPHPGGNQEHQHHGGSQEEHDGQEKELPPVSISDESLLLGLLAPLSTKVSTKVSINARCRNDSLLYVHNLRNFTLWATQMYDASAKLPVGLLAGSSYQMGHFDQCLQVGAEQWPTDVVAAPAPVRARYCLARLRLTPQPSTYPGFTRENVSHAFSLQYDPLMSAWEKLMVPKDPSKKPRNILHWAVCVPASCSARDLQLSMDDALQSVRGRYGVNIEVSVEEPLCQTADSQALGPGDITLLLIILLTFGIVLGSSAFDMLVYRRMLLPQNKTISTGQQVLLSFSAYSNLEKLNKPDPTDEMGILHGLRLFSMVFIILGHRCLTSYGGPFFNPQFLEERYRKFEDMFLLNGTLVVDTFFVLSGFLTCFGILAELFKRKTISVPMLYLYRWMRLTPVYMMMVFFYATLLSKLGSGPLWEERVGRERDRCADNWWANLLYVNNYVHEDRLCMFQSWYITCDMHYFLLAPLIVVPLFRKPKLGMAVLGSALFLSVAVPFAVTFIGGYSGVLRVYMSLLEDPPSKEDYYGVYIKSHNRAGPYFVGMAAAFLFGIMKVNKMKISTPMMWGCSMVATVFGLSSLFGSWSFYIPGREYYPLEHATYASLHRIGWALTVSWVMLGGCTTRFSVLQPLLQLHAFLPLSRLTYCAFLTHGAVQLYSLGTLRSPEYMSFPKLFWMASGDVVISFIFALFVHLLFEAPLGGLQKMILRGQRAKPSNADSNNAQAGQELPARAPAPVEPPPSQQTREEVQV